jgi:hypothetical protein
MFQDYYKINISLQFYAMEQTNRWTMKNVFITYQSTERLEYQLLYRVVFVMYFAQLFEYFLISSFRHVLYVVCNLSGCSPAYGV